MDNIFRRIRAALRSRRGSEIVEASIVLPVIILTILSMIMLMLFFWSCLISQTGLHRELTARAADEAGTVRIISDERDVSGRLRGISGLLLGKEQKARIYAMNEARIVRLREGISGFIGR